MRDKQHQLIAGLLFSLTTLHAEAVLTPYSSAGIPLFYSSVSNATWTSDANLLYDMEKSNPNMVSIIINTVGSITDTPNYYDTPFESYSGSHTLTTDDFGIGGQVSWFGAKAFVNYLNIIKYAGSSQWDLPSGGANPQRGYDQTGGQLGQLWYTEQGGKAGYNIQVYPPFIFNYVFDTFNTYWLSTEYAPVPDEAWYFYTRGGEQDIDAKIVQEFLFAWAVSPGLVSVVPEPGAVWQFGIGLMALFGLKRLRHAG
jgi:hypothetical protein